MSCGGDEEEWSQPDFTDAYHVFFESRRPVTAYQYASNDKHGLQRNDPPLTAATDPAQMKPLLARLVENQRLTANDRNEDMCHLRQEVEQLPSTAPNILGLDGVPYQAGNVVSIMPSNSHERVQRFMLVLPEQLQKISDQVLEIQTDRHRTRYSFRWEGGRHIPCWLWTF